MKNQKDVSFDTFARKQTIENIKQSEMFEAISPKLTSINHSKNSQRRNSVTSNKEQEKKKYLVLNVTEKQYLPSRDHTTPKPSIIDRNLVETDHNGSVKRVKFENLKYDHSKFYKKQP